MAIIGMVPNTQQIAKYCFNIPEKGLYRLDGNVYGPDLLSDSFYVRVDSKPTAAYLWDVLRNTTYLTDSLNNRFLADPVLLKLPSGPHTVTVYLREDGTRLDKLELVYTDTYTEPVDRCQPPKRSQAPCAPSIPAWLRRSTLRRSISLCSMQEQRVNSIASVCKPIVLVISNLRGMLPGQYIVRLELPTLYTSSVIEVPVTATFASAVEITFDVAIKTEKLYMPMMRR